MNSKEAAQILNVSDLDWHNALVAEFGADANAARYDGRGKGAKGSKLAIIHATRAAAYDAWCKAVDAESTPRIKLSSNWAFAGQTV